MVGLAGEIFYPAHFIEQSFLGKERNQIILG